MRRLVCSLLIALVVAGLSATTATAEPDKKSRYIVVLQDSVQDPEAVAREHSRSHGARPDHVFENIIKGYSAEISEGRVNGLERDPRVLYVEPEPTVSITAQTLPTGVNRIEADKNAVAKIDGIDDRVDVDIAVIDTGIDLDHPDLNVVASTNCSVSGILTTTCSGSGDDDNGHGSHVAGTAAAKDNSIGVVGVAPGARLHAVKVLDATGNGLGGGIIAGLDWVGARTSTIDVVNMSLSGDGYFAAERTAIQRLVNAGVVVVVAAGNASRDVYGADGVFGNSDDTSPAAFPEAMTISSLADFDGIAGGTGSGSISGSCTENRDDSMSCYSNYSRFATSNPVSSPGAKIDLALPGTNIYSTHMNGGYTTMSGTSMASPAAAGLAGLYVAANGRATNAAGVYGIRQALINAGQPQASANGLAFHDDPDANKEPIGWALGWTGSGGGTPPPPPPGNAAPTANFTQSCTNLACNFTDTSTDSDGTVVAWSWNFGDGSTSTLRNPSKTYGTAGTYSVVLTVTDDDGATASKTASVTVTTGGGDPDPGAYTLTNGVAKSDTNGAKGTWKYYKILVPAGRSSLTVQQTGASSCSILSCNPDLDLYVRKGARPTTASYNCRQQTNGSNETCTISAPAADYWYIGVYVYSGTVYNSYTIKATY
ncbi:MAG TPA: S8 family serine peptidase [Actinomycetota bacterium]|nr:S8 family serine peptidase [Actinomycetota bacterium]